VAGAYIDETVKLGDVLDVSAPRGNFTLRPGAAPVVFLSAGIGATPVIAILHALTAEASQRAVWWLYGARSSRDHPFAKEARTLVRALAHGHSHIRYSLPDPEDRFSAQVHPTPRASPLLRGRRHTCLPDLTARDRWFRSSAVA
jgi:ferredoxin-NADP reductase